MDALVARANAVNPLGKAKSQSHASSSKREQHPTQSIAKSTAVPKSFQKQQTSEIENAAKKSYQHIANPRLRKTLKRDRENAVRARALAEDANEMLLTEDPGLMQVEGEMDRTWRVTQDEIVQAAGQDAARGRREWTLDGGPYKSRYTRNGRHLAIMGSTGHVSTFDWQTGALHCELQLQETCRDITFLNDQSHFAVAQKKYVFIYDKNGVELHCLKAHVEPTQLEYLPYHWLLASVGNAGYLKYQDTSTGQLLIEHRTKLGSCNVMTQNKHNAVIHLGHQNGTVTLWTPNLPHPAVRLLAHLGPVMSVSVDPSSGGRYMATGGRDGVVKVWDCRNWKGSIREWNTRSAGVEVQWSAKGSLAVASGSSVNVHHAPSIHTPFKPHVPPPLYLTHTIPHRPLVSLNFCPYQDILTVGHSAGLSSILVPGSGEPNFDSAEADPFENSKARREREVKGLLDKIQPDMINLDADFVGSMAPEPKLTTTGGAVLDIPYSKLPRLERLRVSGKADEADEFEGLQDEDGDEETNKQSIEDLKAAKEKRKMRGRNKSLKRFVRKQRKNVIDPTAVAVRAKLEKQKSEAKRARDFAAGKVEIRQPSALDRFRRKKD